MVYLSSVISFKVPKEIKEKAKKLKRYVNWSQELRDYFIRRVQEVEREVNMRIIIDELKKTEGVPRGSAVASVRENRDSS